MAQKWQSLAFLVKVKFKHNWTDNFQMGPIEEGLIKIITGCLGSRLGQVALAIRHVKMICLVVLWDLTKD